MRKFSVCVALVLHGFGPVWAQGGAGGEAAMLAAAADSLSRHAAEWFAAGYHRRARELWLEVIGAYQPHHEAAHKGLCEVRLGTTWAPDSAHPYPSGDDARGSSAGLQRKWQALCASLAKRHYEAAEALAKDGEAERAAWHYRRALRFAPEDEAAGVALGLQRFAGVWASADEVVLLRRARRIDQVASFLLRTDFDVAPVADPCEAFAAAGVRHRGVRSAHFLVVGTLPAPQLVDAAKFAERSYWLCRASYSGAPGFRVEPEDCSTIGVVGEEADWRKLLEHYAGSLDANVLERAGSGETSALYLPVAGGHVFLVRENLLPQLRDQVVRGVARDLADLHPHALREGIGREVAHLLLPQDLVHLVGEGSPGIDDGAQTRVASGGKSPAAETDLADWQHLAVEQAWRSEGAPLARLLRATASDLRPAERVRAWALCAYALRRDPALLRELSEGASDARAEEIDQVQREFWRESERLLPLAVRPAHAEPARADTKLAAWFDAINAARLRVDLEPIGWSVAEEPVGAEPLAGQGAPERAVRAWLEQPAARQRLLDPFADLLAAATTGQGVALGGTAAVGHHDAEMRAFADDPLVLHCFGDAGPQPLADAQCQVRAKGQAVAGTIDTSAGVWAVFTPGAPLPKGETIDVEWSWPGEGGVRMTRKVAWRPRIE